MKSWLWIDRSWVRFLLPPFFIRSCHCKICSMSAHSEIRKEDKNNYCYAVFIGAVFIIGMKLLTLSEPTEQKKGRAKLDRNAKCYSSSFLLNLVVSHFKNGSVAIAASVAYSQTADFNADAHTCLLTLGFIASSKKCLFIVFTNSTHLKIFRPKRKNGSSPEPTWATFSASRRRTTRKTGTRKTTPTTRTAKSSRIT